MRLIHTTTMEMREFFDSDIPKYAILSHCWGEGETSFERYQTPGDEESQGYQKVATFCRIAKEQYDLQWGWADTCCIDKRSSAELSEAINAMFNFYGKADVCIAFLYDVQAWSSGLVAQWHNELSRQFRKSRWFSRGWTLQELLAPRRIAFYSSSWHIVGVKNSNETSWRYIRSLEAPAWRESVGNFRRYANGSLKPGTQTFDELLADITNIPLDVLHKPTKIYDCCVAQKLSWMQKRFTSREEDVSYCLFGMLEVNMPLLYGEGGRRAWERLQQEIVRTSSDESIFAWGARHDLSNRIPEARDDVSWILAESIRDFADLKQDYYTIIREITAFPRSSYVIGNQGLELKVLAGTAVAMDFAGSSWLVIPLNCTASVSSKVPIVLRLRQEPCGHYSRADVVVTHIGHRLFHSEEHAWGEQRNDISHRLLTESMSILVHATKEAATQCRTQKAHMKLATEPYTEGLRSVCNNPRGRLEEHCPTM